MTDYDFFNLSPPEFEQLCRDLLQRHLQMIFESFPEGKDKGIDLRYVLPDKSSIIVQCKRYSDAKQLLKSLKMELPKVRKLNPARYLIATSASLSPSDKDKIIALFEGYVQSPADILGQADLNNLLYHYPEIEKKNFKLWLPGVAALENILHNQLVNESLFEWSRIEETIRTYVYNDSFDVAMDVLMENGYVMISGNPGIGKTTLARMLVYHLMAGGYEEFIYLSGSINDGYAKLKPGVKQVFFYDDFLGSNFLGQQHMSNEDQRVLRFIGQVKASKDKLLILTTREYILAQAKLKFEGYNDPSLENSKCVIDVGSYSSGIRGKILYNHFYFSNLPEEYIRDLQASGSYRRITEHRAFSPRIIQVVSAPEFWKDITPREYSMRVEKFLDYPDAIWKHAYENQISEFAKCILAIFVSMDYPFVLVEDLRNASQHFVKVHAQKYQVRYSQQEFNKCMKELDNTFLIVPKAEDGNVIVQIHNPSVTDFLVQYLHKLPDFVEDIMAAALFFNQLLCDFTLTYYMNDMQRALGAREREFHPNAPVALIKKRLMTEWEQLETTNVSIRMGGEGEKLKASRGRSSDYQKLVLLVDKIPLDNHEDLRWFASRLFYERSVPSVDPMNEIIPYFQLLDTFFEDHDFDGRQILKAWIDIVDTNEDFLQFCEFRDFFPDEYDEFLRKPSNYRPQVMKMLNEYLEEFPDGMDPEDIESLETILEMFEMENHKPAKKLMTMIWEQVGNEEEDDEDFDDYDEDDDEDDDDDADDIGPDQRVSKN